MKRIYFLRFKTSLGPLDLSATSEGLHSLEFDRTASPRSLRRPSGPPRNDVIAKAQSARSNLREQEKMPPRIAFLLKNASREVRLFLKGEKVDLRHFPIDWTGYRTFEKRVLQELQKVPWGRTETYQFLARRAGRPKATRYVGRILNRNWLPLILPCHRIVPKKGGLGGFSKGIGIKRRLLKLESGRADKKGE